MINPIKCIANFITKLMHKFRPKTVTVDEMTILRRYTEKVATASVYKISNAVISRYKTTRIEIDTTIINCDTHMNVLRDMIMTASPFCHKITVKHNYNHTYLICHLYTDENGRYLTRDELASRSEKG